MATWKAAAMQKGKEWQLPRRETTVEGEGAAARLEANYGKRGGRTNVNGFNDDNNVNDDNNANNDTNVNDAHAVSDFMSGSHEYSAFPASFRENQACAEVLMARNIAKITEKFVILHP